MSAFGPKQTSRVAVHMSAFGGKADIKNLRFDVPSGMLPALCNANAHEALAAKGCGFCYDPRLLFDFPDQLKE